uniref:Defective in cullin neddylation protein n=1 Tax=Albugo laibachii Nc14 TaxID=890382 RepID=F0WHZ2_9STRA|nr:DCN1like protein putative [Albugo laibachii Nc14]|eukprot:CCA20869.1 DCN1like protein putative [Albugo laibachii Nc14]
MELIEIDLSRLRIKELHVICKRYGVRIGGKKAEIINRIQSHPDYQAQSDSTKEMNLSFLKKRPAQEHVDATRCAKKLHIDTGQFTAAIDALFDRFRDPEEVDVMSEEGIFAFCEALRVDPQDPVILVLSYYMNAANMCVYSRHEFHTGLRALQCYTLDALQQQIPHLREKLKDKKEFSLIYSYSFVYAKDDTQKCLAKELALELWKILLPCHFCYTEFWIAFVQANLRNSISKDLWIQVLEFGSQIRPDMSNYDENEAWPVLLDEFVYHMKALIREKGLSAVIDEEREKSQL